MRYLSHFVQLAKTVWRTLLAPCQTLDRATDSSSVRLRALLWYPSGICLILL